jgi:hypothetical protein
MPAAPVPKTANLLDFGHPRGSDRRPRLHNNGERLRKSGKAGASIEPVLSA